MLQLLLTYMFGFCAVALMVMICSPAIMARVEQYLAKRSSAERERLDEMFVNVSQRNMGMTYLLSPIIVGALAWLLSEQWIGAVVGAIIGVMLPRILVAQADRMRRNKFRTQLVDGLLLLSSSLKAGLSMLQAFSVVAEEMPPPISQEFGLVLKETKMGIEMAEAMGHLKKRMPSDDINLFVTSVLVSRETGGDVTHIFGRLVETLRERNKLKERVTTLTFMTRMQGVIMGMLPFAFGYLVYQMDHNYFQFFLKDQLGRVMLVVIVVMQIIGGLLFARFSRSPL